MPGIHSFLNISRCCSERGFSVNTETLSADLEKLVSFLRQQDRRRSCRASASDVPALLEYSAHSPSQSCLGCAPSRRLARVFRFLLSEGHIQENPFLNLGHPSPLRAFRTLGD